ITAGSLMVVATILAATAALFLWKRWRFAIGIVSAVAMSLAGFWIGMHLSQPALALTVAFVFSAVVTVTAVAFQLIWRKQPLVITTATLLLSGAFLVTGAMAAVVSGELFGLSADGVVLAALAAAYLIGAPAVRAGIASKRDLRTVLWSIGLTLFAAGLLTIADGSHLVLALAALGALLTWISIKLDEPRLQVAAVVYAGIATLFLLTAVAPPTHLFDETIQPYRHAQGIEAPAFGPELLGILAVAASLTAMAGLARDRLGAWPAWIAGGLAVYAASLIVVWLFGATVDAGESGQSVFQSAQTTVSVLWGAIGFALLVAGLRSRWAALRTAGFLLLGVALSKLVLYDLTMLTAMARVVSFLAVGLVMLFAAAVHQRLAGEPIERKRKLSQS
ncbi:MAG: putative rane protein, partial [Solirubrobacterales bacterium]|nr:putative rane protein [Solirubrobacterales bacterium]